MTKSNMRQTGLHPWQQLVLACAVAIVLDSLSIEAARSDDIIAKLGEPRRNVTTKARTAEEVSQQLAGTYLGVTGVIPLMIFPSKSFVVENAFKALESAKTCRSILADYDRRLRAQYGDIIRHGLYCVSIDGGQLKSIETIAKSF